MKDTNKSLQVGYLLSLVSFLIFYFFSGNKELVEVGRGIWSRCHRQATPVNLDSFVFKYLVFITYFVFNCCVVF